MQSFVDSFYSSSSRFISKEGRKEGDSSKYFSRRKRRRRKRRGIVENFIGQSGTLIKSLDRLSIALSLSVLLPGEKAFDFCRMEKVWVARKREEEGGIEG